MKKLIFSFILVTFSFILHAQFRSSKDPFITKSLKDESFGKIDAETSHGNISVSVVPAAESRIEVYIHANNSNDEISKEEIQKRLDDNYTLEVSVSGGQLSVIARQKRDFNDWRKSLSISFTIYTAKAVSNNLKTSHGNIDLSGMEGNQDMATSHGNITVENTTGKLNGETSHGNISISGVKDEIDFSTSHGNVEVKNCEGTVKLTTSNGNVELKNIKGKVNAGTSHGNVVGDNITGELAASTSHGNVSLENLACSVETSTSHGDILVSANKLSGNIAIDNSGGNITIRLPKGKGVDLDLGGKRINIDAMQNFSGSKDENSVKGTLNGGGEKIKANTVKGTVSLSFN